MYAADRLVDVSDYFDVNLLDGKKGKVSRDRTKVRFGDLYVDLQRESLSSVDINDSKCSLGDTSSEPLSESEFGELFPASKEVFADVLRIPNDGKLYWMLTLVTPYPKHMLRLGEPKNHVVVMAVGTE